MSIVTYFSCALSLLFHLKTCPTNNYGYIIRWELSATVDAPILLKHFPSSIICTEFSRSSIFSTTVGPVTTTRLSRTGRQLFVLFGGLDIETTTVILSRKGRRYCLRPDLNPQISRTSVQNLNRTGAFATKS